MAEGKDYYEIQSKYLQTNFNIKFRSSVSRKDLNIYYKNSHFLFLPSKASEGFPKVITEAACYGCIPCVSNVSSIEQYINQENGLVFSRLELDILAQEFCQLLDKGDKLEDIAKGANKTASLFTYDRYNKRIMQEILNLK